jgi:DnaK suppressor protein
MTPEQLAEFRSVLSDRLVMLDQNEAATSAKRQPVELDQQSVGRLSRMDALQNQAMAQAESTRRHIDKTRILAALDRIEKGTFGICPDCEEDVNMKRLNFDPAIALCLDCARGS